MQENFNQLETFIRMHIDDFTKGVDTEYIKTNMVDQIPNYTSLNLVVRYLKTFCNKKRIRKNEKQIMIYQLKPYSEKRMRTTERVQFEEENDKESKQENDQTVSEEETEHENDLIVSEQESKQEQTMSNQSQTNQSQGESIVEKQYKYSKNGKEIVVKRKYTIKTARLIQNDELDQYFRDNEDELRSKKKLKDIVEEYNKNHSKVSYAKFYVKYKNVFGYRKNRKTASLKAVTDVPSTDNNDHLSESRETSEDKN